MRVKKLNIRMLGYRMQSLPEELQGLIICADWSGLRFALTCRAFASYVKENAEGFRTKYSHVETIRLKDENYITVTKLPNGIYYGPTQLFNAPDNPIGIYLYENNEIVRFFNWSAPEWVHSRQTGNVNYRCYTGKPPRNFDIAAAVYCYDTYPTDIDDDGDPFAMYTVGCTTGFAAAYYYKDAGIMVEMEWGSLKVNVRVHVIFYEKSANVDMQLARQNTTGKNVARVYPGEQRDDLWTDHATPNRSVLCDLASGYLQSFLRDESLEYLLSTEENKPLHLVIAEPGVKLPPGFGRID